ncbi:MAG TPA: hypothetical protein VM554_05815 [Acidisarcina sp.]|nr:hypothetical protein [Acidisarcina sp.]
MKDRHVHMIQFDRAYKVSGIISAIILSLLFLGTGTGRNTLAWICIRSTEAVTNAQHIRALSLDRFDPTCPQCM